MKISIVGAGKVAYFIAKRFLENKHQIVEVYNRTEATGKDFAAFCKARFIENIAEISTDIDALFILVKDDAILEISNEIKDKHIFQIHCSGSLPLTVLNTENAAVIWPVYSIGKQDLRRDVPLILESKEENVEKVKEIANVISSNWNLLQFKQRAILHLTAVISNNFINHLLAEAKEILEKEAIPFDILKPIIQQTVENALNDNPFLLQTGPALRNDKKTMEQHLLLLENWPDVKELYRAISKSIQQFHNIK